MLRKGLLFVSSTVALAGCGSASEESAKENSVDTETEIAGQPEALDATREVPAEQAAPPQAVSNCPDGSGVFCRGPVVVRVANANISYDQYRFGAGTDGYVGRVSFVIENVSDGPIRFNVLGRDTIGMTLENGVQLNMANRRETRGVQPCRYDLERCFEQQNDDFVDLPVGESPASVDIVFDSRTSTMNDRSMPRVTETSVNLPLVIETTDGRPFKVDATFRGVPVFNNFTG